MDISLTMMAKSCSSHYCQQVEAVPAVMYPRNRKPTRCQLAATAEVYSWQLWQMKTPPSWGRRPPSIHPCCLSSKWRATSALSQRSTTWGSSSSTRRGSGRRSSRGCQPSEEQLPGQHQPRDRRFFVVTGIRWTIRWRWWQRVCSLVIQLAMTAWLLAGILSSWRWLDTASFLCCLPPIRCFTVHVYLLVDAD